VARGTPGAFAYALYASPDTLDSAKTGLEVAAHPTWLLCDALINLSRDGRTIEPGLAESWTSSADGLTVVVKLRSGVVLHDGTPLDAQVVRASVERHFVTGHPLYTAEPKNTKERLLADLVSSVSGEGLTVRFKLKYPGFHHLTLIHIVSPAALARLGSEFGRQPLCSGPFKFESWTAEQITLVANDRYWRGRPRLDRVVFRILHDPKAVVEAFERRELDYAPIVSDLIFLERLREMPGVTLLPMAPLNVSYLGFYVERPPVNDARLRRALGHAINVPRLVQFLGRGAAIPARGPLAPGMKSYDESVAQPAYDPAAARDLLARAGHASGLRLSLVHHEMKARDTEVAEAIRADLERVGVTVDLQRKATYGELTAAIRAREGHMFLLSWQVRAPYPERMISPLFHSRAGAGTNVTGYRNRALDRLLDAALVIPDTPERDRAYRRVQEMIVRDAPAIFLYHLTRTAVIGPRLSQLELDPGAHPVDKLVSVDLSP
jgi:peptide/nickel transport system substrate-binding protein